MPLVPHPVTGTVIASSWGSLVADHVVMRFTTAAQRTSQLPAPILNQLTSLDSAPGGLDYWNGTAWVPAGGSRELSYTQITAAKAITATAETSADAVIQGPALTFDGTTAILVEMFAPAVVPAAVAGANIMSFLYQDGLSIGRMGTVSSVVAATFITPVFMARRLVPTAGSHAYTFAAIQFGGNGNIFAGAGGVGAYLPAYLRITRA